MTGAVVGLLLGSAVAANALPSIADFQGNQVWRTQSWYGVGTTFWPGNRTS